jgi:hypothetical protein
VQLVLAATAINLKRLISRFPAAENAADGRDHATRASITAHLAIIDACR